MSQISVNNLTFCYEGSFDNIFENVSFSIDTNWKLGFVGRNGKGKTTFMHLLLGKYLYKGAISTNIKFDYFPYRIEDEQRSLAAVEFIEALKPGCETWRVICELDELGEEADILYRAYESLSPGEQAKILLAVLFSGENDFLLIDEPTNHLDQNARESVKKYLTSKRGFILVSHDRDLLDACIDHVLVLNRKTIEVQSGTFSSWWENKRRKDQFAVTENEKHLREIKKLRQAARRTAEWADKNESTKIGFDPVKEHDRFLCTRAYIGSKTKKLQSRAKQTEKRLNREIEQKKGLLNDLESSVDLKLEPLLHHKNTIVNAKAYGLKYVGSEKPLFENLTFEINRGERIALCGKNGCGKSTLLRMVMQKAGLGDTDGTIWESGVCETAAGLVISYVPQSTENLKGSMIAFCREYDLSQNLFFTVLRQLDFERVQFFKNMEELSEGQKKKVLLARSLLTPAHLYIWDEPLNYMDVFSRIQIEKLLLEYRPTMLFVEHDLKFCGKIATKIVKLQ